MKETGYKPAVFRRGLLVVLIPSLLGGCLLLVLNFLWMSTSRLSLEEQRRSEIVLNLSICFSALKNYTYDIMTSRFEPLPGVVERTVNDRRVFYRLLEILDSTLLPDDWRRTGEAQQVAEFSRSAQKMAHEAEELAPSISGEKFNSNIARFIRYRKLIVRGLGVADTLESLINKELETLTQMRADLSSQRRILRGAVALGLPVGAAAALAVMFSFARGIVVRLKLLAQNAGNLPVLGAPEKNERSLDEFAYLDSAFRQSAQELRDAAEQRQAITQMLAHDMRSPIMATQIYVEILQEVNAASLSGEANDLCTSVKRNLGNVHDFVSDLLVAEKLECEPIELECSPFTLKDALHEALKVLAPLADSKEIHFDVDCEDATVSADIERIIQVLKNYLINAIRFAPLESSISIVSSLSAGSAQFTVRDQGAPVGGDQIDYMFDPFRQAPPDSCAGISVLGMNLRIARLIVEAHGGEFGGESKESGREFWFSFPVDSSKAGKKLDVSDSGLTREAVLSRQSVSPKELFSSSSFQNCIMVFAASLILQAAWLFWLDNRLNDSQLLADQAAVQSDTILNVNRLWLCIFRGNAATAFFLTSGNAAHHAAAEKNIAGVKRLIKVLNSLFSERDRHTNEWIEVRSFALEEVSRLLGMSKKREDEGTAGDLGDLGRLIAQTGELNARIEGLLHSEMTSLSVIRDKQEALRNQFQSIIVFAIFANLIMTVFLLWLFSTNITRRLGLLVEVARKIPTRKPVTEMITGRDEIYQIYWLLCRAALNLNDALEQRKSIMNMLAKDIGLPLSEVQKSLSALEKELVGKTPESTASSLSSARDNINRLLALVDDLLVLDQLEEGKLLLEKGTCSLKEIIDASVNSVGGLALKKQITIKKDCQELYFNADRKRVLQVLVNLLSNAIKFSPKQSVLEIDGSLQDGRVRLAVKDEGPGISPEDAQRIFSRFYQTDEHKKQGFGLGLAICSLIVQSHGGEISVESELGHGSTFIVMLPA